MKANREPEHDPALESTLRRWVVKDPLPPQFQAGVWQRIADAEARRALSSGEMLGRWLEAVLPRPKVALVYVTVLLGLGVLAGTWAAQRENTRLTATLGSRYVGSIDPFHARSDR